MKCVENREAPSLVFILQKILNFFFDDMQSQESFKELKKE
jgi:hypothetical protein